MIAEKIHFRISAPPSLERPPATRWTVCERVIPMKQVAALNDGDLVRICWMVTGESTRAVDFARLGTFTVRMMGSNSIRTVERAEICGRCWKGVVAKSSKWMKKALAHKK